MSDQPKQAKAKATLDALLGAIQENAAAVALHPRVDLIITAVDEVLRSADEDDDNQTIEISF